MENTENSSRIEAIDRDLALLHDEIKLVYIAHKIEIDSLVAEFNEIFYSGAKHHESSTYFQALQRLESTFLEAQENVVDSVADAAGASSEEDFAYIEKYVSEKIAHGGTEIRICAALVMNKDSNSDETYLAKFRRVKETISTQNAVVTIMPIQMR